MKLVGRIVVGLLLFGNLAMLVALSVHIVHSPGGTHVVAKNQLTLVDTYVNLQSPADLANHPAVMLRMMQAGKGDVLSLVSSPSRAPVESAPEPTAAIDVPRTPSAPAPQTTAPLRMDPPAPKTADPHQSTIFDFPQKK